MTELESAVWGLFMRNLLSLHPGLTPVIMSKYCGQTFSWDPQGQICIVHIVNLYYTLRNVWTDYKYLLSSYFNTHLKLTAGHLDI